LIPMTGLFGKIDTKSLLLRKIEPGDGPTLFAYWSDKEVTRYMNISSFDRLEQVQEMISLLNNLADQEQAFRWAIICKRNNQVLGTCGFNNWDQENHRAEIGYDLGRQYWGKGVMTEALTGLLTYGFQTMGLNRIQALVEPANQASRSLLIKTGFQEEGLLRQYERVKEQFIDLKIYALLKNESNCV